MRKILACLLLPLAFCVPLTASSSLNRQGRQAQQAAYQEQQAQNAVLRDLLLTLRHQVTNQDEEIRKLKERLENEARVVDDIRENSDKLQDLTRTALRGHGETLDVSMSDVRIHQDQLHQDLQQLQHYANSVKELMEQYHRRIQTLETSVEAHTSSLKALESAIQALVEAFPSTDKAVGHAEEATYRVVDGDTLEKIARRHHITIRRLKEVNSLTTDRIIVGQKLKIPPPDNAQ